MSVILVLILLSIAFAVAFLAAFIWAVRSGQYEDTCTPSMRLLVDELVGVVGLKDRRPRLPLERRAPARREPAALQRAEQELGAPAAALMQTAPLNRPSPSPALRAPSPPVGERDGVRGCAVPEESGHPEGERHSNQSESKLRQT